MPKGWRYGEGEPASTKTVKIALQLVTEACHQHILETDAFLGVDGEIQVSMYQNDRCTLEFIVEVDGLITFTYEENNNQKDYKTCLSINDAVRIIEDITSTDKNKENIHKQEWKEAWRWFALYTQETTNLEKDVLLASPSETQVLSREARVFQFLIRTVATKQVEAPVSTLTTSTQASQSTLESIGSFPNRSCLTQTSV